MTALAGAGELNRVVAWLRLAAGAGTGLFMGLWSFDGPVAARAWIGNYGATSRRLLRLGHIAFFGLGIVKLLLVKNHPAAVLLRTKFDGSWDAARDAFKKGELSEADMQMLFDFRKKVVDGLANEIKANPRIGGDWKAFGSEKLTSDYDLNFSGPMAEVAVALFNARWAARWGDAVGIGVKILHLGFDDIGRLDRLARFIGLVDDPPGFQVFYPDPVKSLPLAWLYKLVFDDHTRILIDHDLESRSKFVGAVTRHRFSCLKWR